MSESILRLRVQSDEYDSKLKRAAEGLTRYAEQCRKAGGTLQYVDEGVLEFTRSLGKMDTVATTTRGKLAELTKTYTELSAQYRKMTDEEKQGEYGKALASSLDQLRGRIQSSKQELDDINKSINGGGGLTSSLDNLAGKFGLSIKQLTGWGAAIAAAKGALDVAKDAFFASEATVDEWGRVMDSSKSLYEGFLTALNTGDISGYLSRIDEIVSAARAAYNELDRLGTMKTIQAPRISAQQTENERMRMMIQTGRYIAPVDGRRATMAEGQRLTKEQIQRIEKQLQNGMKSVVGLVSNEVKQTGRAIDAVYNRQAQELGMSLKEFRKGTSSMAEFDKRMAGYQKYEQWRKDNSFTDAWGNRQVRPGNPYEEYKKWNIFRVDGDRYNDLVKLIQQRDQQAAQAYSMQGQTYRTMNRAEGVTVRSIMNGGGGGGGTTSPVPVKIEGFDINAAATAGARGVDTMPSVFGMLKDSGAAGINAAMGSISPDLSADIEKQMALVDELREKWSNAGGEIRDSYMAQIIEAEDKLRSMLKDSGAMGSISPDLSADIEKQMALVDELREKWSNAGGEIRDSYMAQIIEADDKLRSMLKDSGAMGSISPDLSADIEKQMALVDELREKWTKAGGEIRDSYMAQIIEAEDKLRNLKDEQGISQGDGRKPYDLGRDISSQWKPNKKGQLEQGRDKNDTKQQGEYKSFSNEMANITQGVSGIVSGIEQLGIELPQGLKDVLGGIQAVAGILTGISALVTIITAIQGAKSVPVIGWMLAHGGVVHAAGGYQVPGNRMSGDQVPAMLNSGELVLSQFQQQVLAANLQAGGMQNMHLEASVHGEQIVLAVNNTMKRKNKGELATFR